MRFYDALEHRFQGKHWCFAVQHRVLKYEIEKYPFFCRFRTFKDFCGSLAHIKQSRGREVVFLIGRTMIIHLLQKCCLFRFILLQLFVVQFGSNTAVILVIRHLAYAVFDAVIFGFEAVHRTCMKFLFGGGAFTQATHDTINPFLRQLKPFQIAVDGLQQVFFGYIDSLALALIIRAVIVNVLFLTHLRRDGATALGAC